MIIVEISLNVLSYNIDETSKHAISLTTQADNYIYSHYVWLGKKFNVFFFSAFTARGRRSLNLKHLIQT